MKRKIIKTISKIRSRVLYLIYYIFNVKKIEQLYDNEHKKGNLSYLSDDNYESWKKSMLECMKYHCLHGMTTTTKELWEYFPKANIIQIKSCKDNNSKITVCFCVKNDLSNVKYSLNYYRKNGIEHFCILDNGSTDGTFEYLSKQKDVELFSCIESCTVTKKVVWMNRLVSYCGLNKWYFLIDSDEIITYEGIEEHNFNELISYSECRGIERIKGMMLDVYAKDSIFTNENRKNYRYFDSDSYEIKYRKVGRIDLPIIIGGPRYRIMGIKNAISKHPILYFKKGMIYSTDHYQFPYDECIDLPVMCCLLHYKFYRKFDKAFGIKDNNNDKFINQYNDEISFIYEKSKEYKSSYDLQSIELLDSIKW